MPVTTRQQTKLKKIEKQVEKIEKKIEKKIEVESKLTGTYVPCGLKQVISFKNIDIQELIAQHLDRKNLAKFCSTETSVICSGAKNKFRIQLRKENRRDTTWKYGIIWMDNERIYKDKNHAKLACKLLDTLYSMEQYFKDAMSIRDQIRPYSKTAEEKLNLMFDVSTILKNVLPILNKLKQDIHQGKYNEILTDKCVKDISTCIYKNTLERIITIETTIRHAMIDLEYC
jgi:hypothetical protein